MIFDEPKDAYVNRKVQAFTKDYQRTHELEGMTVDPDEFQHATLEASTPPRTGGTSPHGESAWPW